MAQAEQVGRARIDAFQAVTEREGEAVVDLGARVTRRLYYPNLKLTYGNPKHAPADTHPCIVRRGPIRSDVLIRPGPGAVTVL